MTIQQSHSIGNTIDQLCKGLGQLCSLKYGQPLPYRRMTSDHTERSISNEGIVQVYVTPDHKRLFLHDVGVREEKYYYDSGKRKGSYQDHIDQKLKDIQERERSGFGLGFISAGNCALDLLHIEDDDREVIWTENIEKSTYNNFCELKLLPFKFWYLRGSEANTPVANQLDDDKYHIPFIDRIRKELESYQARIVGRDIEPKIHTAITEALRDCNEK